MSTSALTLGYSANLYAAETKYEIIKQSRNKMYSFSAIGFPVMFYLIFGIMNRHAMIDGISVAKYLLASYCVFGVLGASLFGVGVNLAIERGQGWLELKQASPMPPLAMLMAKSLSAATFALIVTGLLITCGVTLAGVHITPLEVLKLAAIVATGAIPFGAMGLLFGLLAPSNAAPGVINLVYIPMAFCSGLWMPLEMLPHWIQKIAPFLPSYHLSQLAFRALGFQDIGNSSVASHWMALAGFTMLFLGIGWMTYRRANMKA
jgi:ABC-2 type transport system permease protein